LVEIDNSTWLIDYVKKFKRHKWIKICEHVGALDSTKELGTFSNRKQLKQLSGAPNFENDQVFKKNKRSKRQY